MGDAKATHSVRLPKPIVKWAGGKTKLLPELLARAPKSFGRYFEPFAGGAALFFAVRPSAAVLNDANADLMNLYRAVRERPGVLIDQVNEHFDAHCREHYYAVRDCWNRESLLLGPNPDLDRATLFLYLNRTCFNGLWRVNRKGEFNVPCGSYENPAVNASAIWAASKELQGATLRCGDYAEAVAGAGAGDFIYFDPPYQPLTKTANFTSYTADGFGEDDQRRLAGVANDLRRRGCHIMISNHDEPLIRELFADWTIDTVQCARAINSKGSKRGKVPEVIITNGGSL